MNIPFEDNPSQTQGIRMIPSLAQFGLAISSSL